MRSTHLMPAMLASALLVAPMLAYGQTQSTPPGGGPTTTQTTPQAVTPGQPAPPAAGLAPGMTPGGAVGQTPDTNRPPTMTQGERGGTMRPTAPGGTAGGGAPSGGNTSGANMGGAGSTGGAAMGGTTMGGRATAGAGATGAATGTAAFPAGSAVMARPRMSQIIGANVYNDENNSIGSVDDIILVPPPGATAPGAAAGAGDGPLAIVQVGGFLGLGGRLVAVPLRDLQWNAERERMVLPGATRDGLRERPEFNYDNVRTNTR